MPIPFLSRFLSRFLGSAGADDAVPPAPGASEPAANDPLALFEAEADAPAGRPPRPAAAVWDDPAAPASAPPSASPPLQASAPLPASASAPPPASAPVPASVPAPVPVQATQSGLPGSVPLDQIMARRVPVLWPEAVAVMLAACDRLAPADEPERPAPDLAGIRIHADGTVDAADGSPDESSVARLARTLHTMLPAQSTPAPLRLLITKWIDNPDGHTIQEFAKELTYFARPDGDALVRALYERYLAAATATAPATAQPPAPPPPAEPRAAARRTPPRWLLPASAVLAAGAAFGVWYSMPAATVIVEEAAAATLSVVTADSVPHDDDAPGMGTAGTMPLESRALPGAPRRLTDIALPPRRTAAAAPPSSAAGGAVTGAVTGASTLQARTPQAAPPAPATAPLVPIPPLGATPGIPPVAGSAARSARAIPDRIYTSVDAAVEPPQLVYPQLAPPPERPTPDVAINTMEVVVGEDGRVQTAHLVTAPQRMTDMQLLSAAKVWRFEPARLDGTPVRYRMRVSWATTP